MSHCLEHHATVAKQISWSDHLKTLNRQLASPVVQRNTTGFFPLGLLELDRVYANKPSTLHDLQNNIIRECSEINADTCLRVIRNFSQRMKECGLVEGRHLPDSRFHT